MTQAESDLSSFGELLKSFRNRKQLTQQQLADAVGVHRNAVGRWERGDTLPESRGMVLELARHLLLDDLETRHFLEASLTALAPHWLVPLPRNPFFTGREAVLEALHSQLGVDQALALTQSSALYGLGGIGKTQIALEYAYRYALEYSAVFWIAAETAEQILASLLRIAEVLHLSEHDDRDQQQVVVAVQRWLTTHGQWLLIWDNVEDLDLLQRFLPTARSGAILITTRSQTLGTLARSVDLLPMEQEEGILFLLRRAKLLKPEATDEQVHDLAARMPAQYAAAVELVRIMGGLPLALDQAGAYLEETRCGLPAYLDLFRSRRAILLQQRGEGALDHPSSVSTTFTLAIMATAERHPAVWDLLRVCALLQPDAIPEELFRCGAEHLGATLEAVCRDGIEWDRVIATACSYSLLSRQPEEQTLSLHRLVQAVLLDAMTEAEQKLWSERTIKALDAVFPPVNSSTEYTIWKQCDLLLPHVLLCLQREETTEESLAIASLAAKLAAYLRERGQYREAEVLSQRALRIRERILGPDHPDVAVALGSLGLVYWMLGKYDQAEPLYQRDLHIQEQVLGPEHQNLAAPLNNLANLYCSLGKYDEAEPLYKRAIHIREQALGPENPRLIYPLNGLANLYYVKRMDEQAEPLYKRAIRIGEQALGPDHPQLTYPLSSLADLYIQQGKYEQAETLLQRCLRIQETALGLEHPQAGLSLDGLALIYVYQGKYEQAEELYQRALRIQERVLGAEHPDAILSLSGQANLYRDQGRHEEAEALYQRVLSIREQRLGPDHLDTAETLHDLALLRQRQGNLSEALSLARRALKVRSHVLGDAHPKTTATRTLCTQLLEGQVSTLGKPSTSKPSTREISTSDIGERVETSPGEDLPQSQEDDSLQEFLDACCELHPLASCRISDLWRAYEQWTATYQGCVPLSRRAFAEQLKAHGCRSDRTSTARIWRGIVLKNKNP